MKKHILSIILTMLVSLLNSAAQQPVEDDLTLQKYLDKSAAYATSGDNKKAYETLLQAKTFLKNRKNISTAKLITIERNLGEYARRMANLTLAREHYEISIKMVMRQSKPDLYQLYQTYTSLGTLSWYASKLDSAAYFYTKGIETVKKIDNTPINVYYRRALLYNNISGVYSLQGKTNEAIKTTEECITLLQKFSNVKGYEKEKKNAVPLLFEAIDNLSGIYKELGNYAKAEQLLLYSYSQKRKRLRKDDPAIFISQILLGQLYYATSDYKKSLQFLVNGRKAIDKSGTDYLFWDGDACYTLALIYEKYSNNNSAATYYQKADSLYKLAFGGSYDSFYLDFLQNHVSFLAKTGHCTLAKKLAKNTLKYVIDAGNEHSLLPFYQMQNLAKLSLTCKEYKEAELYTKQALTLINKFIKKSETLADSIKTEGEKAKVILYSVKAQYALLKGKKVEDLQALLKQLNEAETIVERKKSILTNQEDIITLIADYKDLTNFIKQINFELYGLTKNKKYIESGLKAHETNLYTRIRSRMEYQQTLKFNSVPTSVLEEEKVHKQKIQSALQQHRNNTVVITSYKKSLDEWQAFLQKLKKNHPDYYYMRYAKKDINLDELQRLCPKGNTIVRYVFSGEGLYAFVISKEKQTLVPLSTKGLEEQVISLRDFSKNDQTPATAYHLYELLWKPIEKHLIGTKVTIIPDGVLYQLSFDMLTPTATKDLSQLAKNCLLNKYAISYHYSLLGIPETPKDIKMKGNFVAFTPVFSDKEKQKHRSAIQENSLKTDQSYLSLLPLPFTEQLARKTQKQFGGSLFSHETSTANNFRSQAGFHRIIHIGTHAETNNNFPQYSRLIFVKDENADSENSIYLYDIYNCNLSSNIAVLTACETGKSNYLDGEGMISMAHAFNYAGSESILAGLWKIDEQSSTIITEHFYNNLEKGMPKDEALQKAKIAYLKNADSRMIAPIYWGGLVIMGDLNPISLEQQFQILPYIVGGILVLLGLAAWLWRKRKNRTSTI